MGWSVTGVQLKCGDCETERVFENSEHDSLGFLFEIVQAAGWDVSLGGGKVRCPNCARKRGDWMYAKWHDFPHKTRPTGDEALREKIKELLALQAQYATHKKPDDLKLARQTALQVKQLLNGH